MKKSNMNVTGMHCTSCEMLIVDTLTEAGASKVKVSHKDGKLAVEYDESKLDESKIKKLVEAEGYKVK
jgi:copper chaperone CopZ